MNIHKSLMTRFVIGAAIMVICLLILTVSQRQAIHTQQLLTGWQAQADKIQLDIANLQQQAQHYKLNAPRDFESYNRDVAVFYQQFKQQLATLDQTFDSANNSVKNLSRKFIYRWLTQGSSPLLQAVQQQSSWHVLWHAFVEELTAEIGDPKEPRLEWAAEYIITQQDKLTRDAVALGQQITNANQWFAAVYAKINTGLVIFVMGYLLFSLTVFALRIIRPISITTRACEAVAAGAYGTNIEVSGSGEMQRLQLAFNELSSRSKLLMNMLSDINQPGNVNDKLQRIYDSGHQALGCNWIGLMMFNEQTVDLNTSVPSTLDKSFRHRHVLLPNALGKNFLNSLNSGWLDIKSLRQISLKHHDERFLRELYKNTTADNVVGYPFRCPAHKNFILLFASNRNDGFSQQQTELIQALSKLMADAIIAGMDENSNTGTIAAR